MTAQIDHGMPLAPFLHESDDVEDDQPLYKPVSEAPALAPAEAIDGHAFAMDARVGTVKAVYRMIKLSLKGMKSPIKTAGLLVANLLVILLDTTVLVAFSNVHRDQLTALKDRDVDEFYRLFWKVGLLAALFVPVLAAQHATSWLFKVEWRTALTNSLARAYYGAGDVENGKMFYRLTLKGDIDNPDQRICNDANDFVQKSFVAVELSTKTTMHMLGFVGVLYSISPRLCFGTFVIAMFGALVSTKGFAPFLVKYHLRQTKQEADLRYCVIRVRENAESIAFFNGGAAEFECFEKYFWSLVDTLKKRMMVHVSFEAFRGTFHFSKFVIPGLLVAPAYLNGDIEFGAVSQAVMAYHIVLDGVALIMTELFTLTEIAVSVKRLENLIQAFERERSQADREERAKITIKDSEQKQACEQDASPLKLSAVTLRTPSREGTLQEKTVLEDVSCNVEEGQSVLVVGESGVGKSSLLRAIAGLWTSGSGEIARKLGTDSFFLPQRPYMFLGTLREQLLYPFLDNPVPDVRLRQVLEEVSLEYLLDRHSLDSYQMWSTILSGGEQQRINFARLLVRDDVKFAMLDEGTSACDEISEARLYNCLKARVKSFVSVGHRPALLDHHTHVLWLRRRGAAKCKTSELDESTAEASWQYMTVDHYKEAQLCMALHKKLEESPLSPLDKRSLSATSVGSPWSSNSEDIV
eukprot:TRINITY_DN5913_c0_g1_i1.p1 TRINITY_DN5913_c0_g1~~TRINITY_DN5913_c0_g1_i1.p1  ORF type:complete len:694 (-),score=123.54 TRINITY_DN5913_c0_g1_i1:1324-3405(-)